RNSLEKLQSDRECQHPNNLMERTVESFLVYRFGRLLPLICAVRPLQVWAEAVADILPVRGQPFKL
ncbi:MAG: hypothetical protein KME23_28360, partial [Goleter apudmare HA4340-LM2]|nr:hypothetical protein [Goleter apudmare HA4340-LM2]